MSAANVSTITIDFETYYDSEYTLKTMTTVEYVNDPRFNVIGYAYKIDGAPAVWVSSRERELNWPLLDLPWSTSVCVAHNAMFDGAILEWHYGVKPLSYMCTQMAARPVIAPFTKSVSLAACSNFLGIGVKGDEVVRALGKRVYNFTDAELEAYGEYCKQDVELTYKLYRVLTEWYRRNNRDVA